MGIQTAVITATNASTAGSFSLTGQGGDSTNGLGAYSSPGVDSSYASAYRATYHSIYPTTAETPIKGQIRVVVPGTVNAVSGVRNKSGFAKLEFTFPQTMTPAERGVVYGMLLALLNDAKIKAQYLSDDVAS